MEKPLLMSLSVSHTQMFDNALRGQPNGPEMEQYCVDPEAPVFVQPSPELELSNLSFVAPVSNKFEILESSHPEVSISSLVDFETHENAAETHESFASTASYATRLRSRSADPGYPLTIPGKLTEQNQNSEQHPDVNPEFDVSDSDVDTISVASVREFHDSLPIITSTPPKIMRNKAALSRKSSKLISPGRVRVVRHLFPGIGADTALKNGQNAPETDQGAPSSARCIQIGDGEILQELHCKSAELRSEVAKFKTENAKLVKVRLESDALYRQLEKDRLTFDAEREKMFRDFDEMKRDELRKLELEKKILYKHMTAQKQDDILRLRESNEALIREVENYKDEIRKSDVRHESVSKRLRDRIKSLEVQLDALRDRADALEEDKQELVREVVRVTKQNGVRAFGKSAHKSNGSSRSATTNGQTTPLPANSKSESDNLESPRQEQLSLARPILKTAEDTSSASSSPKSVRFDMENDGKAVSDTDETISEEIVNDSGTIEQTFRDGRKLRFYKNGTKEEVSKDGRCSTTTYCNGDVKQILPDKEVYYYKANQSIHTKFPDGKEFYQFPNNQVEKLFPDGSKEIHYPNSVIKRVHPNGSDEVRYSNGTVEFWNEKAQTRTICFANGEIEVHTPQWKQRKFPDGSEKVVFVDGRSESRYADGRIRIKDAQGKLAFDSYGNRSAAKP